MEVVVLNGKPAVYLESRGKRSLYLLRIARDGDETRICFEKLGDLQDPVYVVTARPGSWRCNCPAYVYSRALFKSCKHAAFCKSLSEFMQAIEYRTTETGKEPTRA